MNCFGIDIAKNQLDLADQNRNVLRFKNDTDGIRTITEHLLRQKADLVVIEASGGYELDLLQALDDHAINVAVVNPRRIRDFARARGVLAKTDAIDAGVLADYAAMFRPRPNARKLLEHKPLNQLTTRRRQLVHTVVQQKNHLEHAQGVVAESIRRTLAHLEEELKYIETEIDAYIQAHESLLRRWRLLTSVPGVGSRTASMLVSCLPELGWASRREIASLVGIAPRNRDSGQFRGKRMTGGGRREVRTSIYMPTLVALRHNEKIRAYYRHLLSQGKAKMTALVACMRKLLTIINAMIKKNTTWNNLKLDI